MAQSTVAATKPAPTGTKPSVPNVSLRVTEQPNSLSHDLDVASTREVVNILRQCDEQLFAGENGFAGLPVRQNTHASV